MRKAGHAPPPEVSRPVLEPPSCKPGPPAGAARSQQDEQDVCHRRATIPPPMRDDRTDACATAAVAKAGERRGVGEFAGS